MALFITLIAGLFFMVGALLAYFGKNKKGLVDFSIGLSFSVMALLLTFHIVPEAMEMLEDRSPIFMYVFIVMGIVMLKLIDMLVPHHDHESEKKTHHRHLKHIGIISSLALVVHNVIEGIAIYNVALNDTKAGVLMAIAVGLHNIPFGVEITAMLNETKKGNKQVLLNIILLTFSTVLGALLMMLFNSVSNFVLGCLMSLTIGMIMYLLLFELLVELGASKNRKHSSAGLIVGIVFMIILMVIGG